MSTGELTILVTAVTGFAGILVAQWAAIAQANRAAKALVESREQDRLDREQKAKELLDLQRLEIEKVSIKAIAEANEVKRLLRIANEAVAKQSAATISALAENTKITRQGAEKADAAYREANTVNLKIEKLGIESTVQQERIEESVLDTQEKVTEVHEAVVTEGTTKK